MKGVRRCALVLSLVVALIMAGDAASAQMASALVLEIRGASVPGLHPYHEIPANTTISLPSGTTLVFLHYKTCATVVVAGGTLTFTEDTYTISGGIREKETRSLCPRTVALKAGGEMAGIVLRKGAADPPLTLSPQPTFVITGSRAGDVGSVRISHKGKPVLETSLNERRFHWPVGAPPLAVDTEYELTLVPSAAGAIPVTLRFTVAAIPSGPASEVLTVIRVE